jgi:hypothetical protein
MVWLPQVDGVWCMALCWPEVLVAVAPTVHRCGWLSGFVVEHRAGRAAEVSTIVFYNLYRPMVFKSADGA